MPLSEPIKWVLFATLLILGTAIWIAVEGVAVGLFLGIVMTGGCLAAPLASSRFLVTGLIVMVSAMVLYVGYIMFVGN